MSLQPRETCYGQMRMVAYRVSFTERTNVEEGIGELRLEYLHRWDLSCIEKSVHHLDYT